MKYFIQTVLLGYIVAALGNSNPALPSTQSANYAKKVSPYNFNNNYFIADSNTKKVEDMLAEVNHQLTKLKEEKGMKDSNTKKVENMLAEVNHQLTKLKEEKGMKDSNTKKIENMLAEVSHQLTKLKEEKEMKVYKNCAEVYKSGHNISGVYKIDPDGFGEFKVLCDHKTAGGGWIVFQKRFDGSVDFYLAWDDYKQGFGNLNGEFWLGLDKIHRLTVGSSNKLRVDIVARNGKTAFAEYSSFFVARESGKYQMSVGKYSGTAGDGLTYHSGSAFSTKDRDNDKSSSHCVTHRQGAWWHNNCDQSNLNAVYSSKFIYWQSYVVKSSAMKIRPNDF